MSIRAQQPPAAAPKPLVPVAASTLADSPADYYGQHVSVVGTVEQALTTLAFTIDQDRTRATGKEVLILASSMNAAVERDTYVTVLGEVVQLTDEIASRTTIALPPELVSKYRGRPAVLATSILNASMVDLARRLPPPLTPAEQAFDAAMKRVGPAFSALRQAVAASDQAAAQEQASTVKTAVGETLVFWKTARRGDALKWAADAQRAAETIEQSSARGDWDAAKTAVTSLGQNCQNCHGAYRERLEDGTYRMKTLPQ
jgi:cytochrome c556